MDTNSTSPIGLVHITTVPWSLFFIRGQARFMERQGFSITAIASPGEHLYRFGTSEGVRTSGILMLRAISPIADIKSIWNLRAELKRLNPTIVHAHTPKGGLVGMISSWLTRTPVRIYHIRGLPHLAATGPKRRLLAISEWVSCRLAHRVFCVSDSIRQVAIGEGLCPAEKITVFLGGSGNGVDAELQFNPDRITHGERMSARSALGIAADDLVIGFVGRIVRDKGVEELATAWRRIRELHPEAWLLLVGPLEEKDAISAATLQQLSEDPRVILVGDVDDPVPYYSMMDVLVLPTYREGFGNVLIEAASLRIPQVATRVPGCVDAVADGETGVLVPPGDADALGDALSRYLSDSALRSLHGAAGRKRVLDTFRQEAIWEAILAEYNTLLLSRGHDIPNANSSGM